MNNIYIEVLYAESLEVLKETTNISGEINN